MLKRLLFLLFSLLFFFLPFSPKAQTKKQTAKPAVKPINTKEQTTQDVNQSATTPDWLPKKDIMPIGAYYYPEHWNPKHWERDIKAMANLGFTFTHYAEFAWSDLEPEEGKFNFGWLDTAVSLAQKYNLKVIMCTPSPCPPQWLWEKYPEAFAKNSNGLPNKSGGGRLLGSPSSPILREKIAIINQKLAERYGNHPAIWGWQLDNEPHTTPLFDYSDAAQDAFKLWLKKKYPTFEQLNTAWGNSFWSQNYSSWEQIRIPNADEQIASSNTNPHALLDFWRFQADQEADFLKVQFDLLKKTISPNQWVTSNFAYYKFLPEIDLFRFSYLDFASHTMYLLTNFLGDDGGALAFRLGSGLQMAFSNEWARSIKGYAGVMELQPGQINWGAINPQPLPGAVRMWLWHNFAMGSRFICTYRFRQPIYGGEQYHKGIMEMDGTTVSEGGKEFVKVINELQALKPKLNTNAVPPLEVQKRAVAFYYDLDNVADLHIAPQSKSYDYFEHLYLYFGAAKRAGSSVTFVNKGQKIDAQKYPYLIVHTAPILEETQLKIFEEYVKNGGHILFGPRTAIKNKFGHLQATSFGKALSPLTGHYVPFYDFPPPAEKPMTISSYPPLGNSTYPISIYSEYLESVDTGAKSWASYSPVNPLTKGKTVPAVTHKKLGKGSVTYIGTLTKEGKLEADVLSTLMKTTGANPLQLAPYFFVEWRDGVFVAVNYTSMAQKAPIGPNAEILFGQENVPPAGVCIWKP